jgi:hypothetical protein
MARRAAFRSPWLARKCGQERFRLVSAPRLRPSVVPYIRPAAAGAAWKRLGDATRGRHRLSSTRRCLPEHVFVYARGRLPGGQAGSGRETSRSPVRRDGHRAGSTGQFIAKAGSAVRGPGAAFSKLLPSNRPPRPIPQACHYRPERMRGRSHRSQVCRTSPAHGLACVRSSFQVGPAGRTT